MPSEPRNRDIAVRNPAEAVQPIAGKNYLLAIAIDKYIHLPPLYNCVKDAEDLIALLKEKYRFEEENIRTLKNEEATREARDRIHDLEDDAEWLRAQRLNRR